MASTQREAESAPASQTLLLVEDDVDMLATYRVWLSGRECTLRTARTGKRAITQFSDEVDAVALDRKLPDFGAAAVLNRIDYSDVPVAVISAFEPNDRLDTDDVMLYLDTPMQRSEFSSAVDQLLGH
ncbi:MAG: response regulator [Halorubrum sp.]